MRADFHNSLSDYVDMHQMAAQNAMTQALSEQYGQNVWQMPPDNLIEKLDNAVHAKLAELRTAIMSVSELPTEHQSAALAKLAEVLRSRE